MIETSLEQKTPTYLRQMLLLFFLESLGKVTRWDLQKLIFLYTQENRSKHYTFIPYRYGCYSFLCASDMELLEKRGWIVTSGRGQISLKGNLEAYGWAADNKEREKVRAWLKRNTERGYDLIAETYRRYPYYAFHSRMKKRLLTTAEIERVERSIKPVDKKAIVIFTIGYEGISFEDYLNKLIHNRVSMVCDVRRNPLSRKFGFSRGTISQELPKIGIEYMHFPELGIPSEKRQNLNSREDYEKLFTDYRKNLPKLQPEIERLKHRIDDKKRIALTCFEELPHYCHRHCIVDFLQAEYGYKIVHL